MFLKWEDLDSSPQLSPQTLMGIIHTDVQCVRVHVCGLTVARQAHDAGQLVEPLLLLLVGARLAER